MPLSFERELIRRPVPIVFATEGYSDAVMSDSFGNFGAINYLVKIEIVQTTRNTNTVQFLLKGKDIAVNKSGKHKDKSSYVKSLFESI
jgi:hypothetical protein